MIYCSYLNKRFISSKNEHQKDAIVTAMLGNNHFVCLIKIIWTKLTGFTLTSFSSTCVNYD
jgi:hypothetical protein